MQLRVAIKECLQHLKATYGRQPIIPIQPDPIPNDEEPVYDRVASDLNRFNEALHGRYRLGIQRYGTALQPYNGRDAVEDLKDEILDAIVYAKQACIERDSEQLQAIYLKLVAIGFELCNLQ